MVKLDSRDDIHCVFVFSISVSISWMADCCSRRCTLLIQVFETDGSVLTANSGNEAESASHRDAALEAHVICTRMALY